MHDFYYPPEICLDPSPYPLMLRLLRGSLVINKSKYQDELANFIKE